MLLVLLCTMETAWYSCMSSKSWNLQPLAFFLSSLSLLCLQKEAFMHTWVFVQSQTKSVNDKSYCNLLWQNGDRWRNAGLNKTNMCFSIWAFVCENEREEEAEVGMVGFSLARNSTWLLGNRTALLHFRAPGRGGFDGLQHVCVCLSAESITILFMSIL